MASKRRRQGPRVQCCHWLDRGMHKDGYPTRQCTRTARWSLVIWLGGVKRLQTFVGYFCTYHMKRHTVDYQRSGITTMTEMHP